MGIKNNAFQITVVWSIFFLKLIIFFKELLEILDTFSGISQHYHHEILLLQRR